MTTLEELEFWSLNVGTIPTGIARDEYKRYEDYLLFAESSAPEELVTPVSSPVRIGNVMSPVVLTDSNNNSPSKRGRPGSLTPDSQRGNAGKRAKAQLPEVTITKDSKRREVNFPDESEAEPLANLLSLRGCIPPIERGELSIAAKIVVDFVKCQYQSEWKKGQTPKPEFKHETLFPILEGIVNAERVVRYFTTSNMPYALVLKEGMYISCEVSEKQSEQLQLLLKTSPEAEYPPVNCVVPIAEQVQEWAKPFTQLDVKSPDQASLQAFRANYFDGMFFMKHLGIPIEKWRHETEKERKQARKNPNEKEMVEFLYKVAKDHQRTLFSAARHPHYVTYLLWAVRELSLAAQKVLYADAVLKDTTKGILFLMFFEVMPLMNYVKNEQIARTPSANERQYLPTIDAARRGRNSPRAIGGVTKQHDFKTKSLALGSIGEQTLLPNTYYNPYVDSHLRREALLTSVTLKLEYMEAVMKIDDAGELDKLTTRTVLDKPIGMDTDLYHPTYGKDQKTVIIKWTPQKQEIVTKTNASVVELLFRPTKFPNTIGKAAMFLKSEKSWTRALAPTKVVGFKTQEELDLMLEEAPAPAKHIGEDLERVVFSMDYASITSLFDNRNVQCVALELHHAKFKVDYKPKKPFKKRMNERIRALDATLPAAAKGNTTYFANEKEKMICVTNLYVRDGRTGQTIVNQNFSLPNPLQVRDDSPYEEELLDELKAGLNEKSRAELREDVLNWKFDDPHADFGLTIQRSYSQSMDRDHLMDQGPQFVEPLFLSPTARSPGAVQLYQRQYPCCCTATTLLEQKEPTVIVVWSIEEILPLGLPAEGSDIVVVPLNSFYPLQWILQKSDNYHAGLTVKTGDMHQSLRKVTLEEAFARVFKMPAHIQLDWHRRRFESETRSAMLQLIFQVFMNTVDQIRPSFVEWPLMPISVDVLKKTALKYRTSTGTILHLRRNLTDEERVEDVVALQTPRLFHEYICRPELEPTALED